MFLVSYQESPTFEAPDRPGDSEPSRAQLALVVSLVTTGLRCPSVVLAAPVRAFAFNPNSLVDFFRLSVHSSMRRWISPTQLALCIVFVASPAFAANVSWTGVANDNLWNTAAN